MTYYPRLMTREEQEREELREKLGRSLDEFLLELDGLIDEIEDNVVQLKITMSTYKLSRGNLS